MANVLSITRGCVWGVAGSLFDNPIISKDFRTRMRERKAFSLMGWYVLLVTVVTGIALCLLWQAYAPGGTLKIDTEFGKQLFLILNGFQSLFLTLVVPILASGAISQEVEHKTIDALVMTRLSSLRIVLGKTLSAFLYAMILVATSIPLAGLCLMFGGISPAEVAYTYLALAGWALLLASATVMWSSMFERTIYATSVSLGLGVLWLLQTSSLLWILIACLRYPNGWTGLFAFFLRGNASQLTTSSLLASNPILAPLGKPADVSMLGVVVSAQVVGFVVTLMSCAILVLLACAHIRYRPVNGAVAVRLLILAHTFVGTLAGVSFYKFSGLSSLPTGYLVAAHAGGAIMGNLWYVVPVCVGAMGRKTCRSVLRYAFSFRRIFKTDIGGAVGFLWLWMAVKFVAFALAAAQLPSSMNPALWSAYVKSAVAGFSIIFAIAALGIFLSSACRSRRAAMGVALVPVIIVRLMIYTVPAMYTSFAQLFGIRGPALDHTGMSLASVLWPPFAVGLTFAQTAGTPLLPAWAGSAWLMSALAYTAIGLVLLLLASPVLKRTGGIRQEAF